MAGNSVRVAEAVRPSDSVTVTRMPSTSLGDDYRYQVPDDAEYGDYRQRALDLPANDTLRVSVRH